MNGYANWDTWALLLWLESDEKCYFAVKKHKRYFLSLGDKRLFNRIMAISGCLDNIDYHKVNFNEVREAIREL